MGHEGVRGDLTGIRPIPPSGEFRPAVGAPTVFADMVVANVVTEPCNQRAVTRRAVRVFEVTDAREAYQRAIEAQKAGDWAKYGEEIKRLGEILERLKQQK